MVKPPSAVMTEPVVYFARGEAKYKAAEAISSGLPIRLIAKPLRTLFKI
jgi:hypothetical protein